jgi:BMFP domain-containing protein YqiC
MVTKNNIFEDLARVSSSVASVAFESVKNIQDSAKSKVNSYAKSADLVTRDEFEAFKKIATKAKTDSENLQKEFSEIKQQIQVLVSSLDVMKGQISKAANADSSQDNKKILSELQAFGESVESKINQFGDILKAQQEEIEKINSSMVEKPKAEKAAPKAKKVVNANPTLFDDEQA